jgi:GNAT superfamily N-acetyltransferase
MNQFENFRQLQIADDTVILPFNSSDNDLNGFLFDDAKRYQSELMTVTYLIEDVTHNKTVAYYSLLADKILFNPENKAMWNKLNRNIPNNKRRRSYPAIKIGRLAVSEEYSHLGIGTMIVKTVMFLFTQTRRFGCRFITVDALQSATSFYEKCGFVFFTEADKGDPTRLMFFDLKNYTD